MSLASPRTDEVRRLLDAGLASTSPEEQLRCFGKAHLAARNKREAVRCLRRALARSEGSDDRARIELAALGLRRPAVLPFLPRSFFLNRLLGRLRHAMIERRAAREDGLNPVPAE